MRTANALLLSGLLLALAGCNQAGSAELSSTDPRTAPAQPAAQEPVSPPAEQAKPESMAGPAEPAAVPAVGPAEISVVMSSATLGDDCSGVGTVPVRAAAPAPKKSRASNEGVSADMAESDAPRGAAARRACQQTSMQLSVTAGAKAAATDLAVKTVQLFDEKGKLVAELTASSPSAWSAQGSYAPWDQKIKPGQTLSVTYALTTPIGDVLHDRSKTWTLKATVTVGGKDKTLQRDVTVFVETILPPGVVT